MRAQHRVQGSGRATSLVLTPARLSHGVPSRTPPSALASPVPLWCPSHLPVGRVHPGPPWAPVGGPLRWAGPPVPPPPPGTGSGADRPGGTVRDAAQHLAGGDGDTGACGHTGLRLQRGGGLDISSPPGSFCCAPQGPRLPQPTPGSAGVWPPAPAASGPECPSSRRSGDGGSAGGAAGAEGRRAPRGELRSRGPSWACESLTWPRQ